MAAITEQLDLLSEEDAARELGLHPGSLARWRRRREGPPFITVGRRIFYRREALRDWLLSREIQPQRSRR